MYWFKKSIFKFEIDLNLIKVNNRKLFIFSNNFGYEEKFLFNDLFKWLLQFN